MKPHLFLIPFLLLTPLHAQEAGENLIENGSFEEGIAHWSSYEGKPAPLEDDTSSTEGKVSLRMQGEDPARGSVGFQAVYQNLTRKLKPDTDYILKGKIKRTALAEDQKSMIAISLLERQTADEPWTQHVIGTNPMDSTNVWEPFELTFRTNSEIEAASVHLYNVSSNAIVWFDEIELHEVP